MNHIHYIYMHKQIMQKQELQQQIQKAQNYIFSRIPNIDNIKEAALAECYADFHDDVRAVLWNLETESNDGDVYVWCEKQCIFKLPYTNKNTDMYLIKLTLLYDNNNMISFIKAFTLNELVFGKYMFTFFLQESSSSAKNG